MVSITGLGTDARVLVVEKALAVGVGGIVSLNVKMALQGLPAHVTTAIAGLEFVIADGSIVNVRRGDPDFDGMVVHLGALGVVTRVTLDLQPAFDVTQTIYEGLTAQSLNDNLDAILDGGYSVSVFTTWRDDSAQIWIKDIASTAAVPASLHGTTLATVKRHPILDMDPVNATDQFSVPGLWYPTRRAWYARVVGTDLDGKEVVVEGTELMARCLQHECDHLDGMLYLDRLDRSVRKKAMRELRAHL